jgi:hypothetical protein
MTRVRGCSPLTVDASKASAYSADTFDLANLKPFLSESQAAMESLQGNGGTWSEWLTAAGNAFTAAQEAAMTTLDSAAAVASAAHAVSSRLTSVPSYSSRAFTLAMSDSRFVAFTVAFARLVDARLARSQLPAGSIPPLFGTTGTSSRVEDDLGGPRFDSVAVPSSLSSSQSSAAVPTMAAVKRSPRPGVPASGRVASKAAVTTVSLNLSSVLQSGVDAADAASTRPWSSRTPYGPASPTASHGTYGTFLCSNCSALCPSLFEYQSCHLFAASGSLTVCTLCIPLLCCCPLGSRAAPSAEATKASPARTAASRASAGVCVCV